MSDKVTLYSYWRSSCSWRVRISMALKGIEYEYVPVHLVKAEQKSVDYSEKNPNQLVPTFQHGDVVISQSLAILEYIEEAFPENGYPLLPKSPADRATVRKLCGLVACDIQPVQNLRVLLDIIDVGGDKMEWGKKVITRGFWALEKELVKSAGKYCFGDNVTLADCCLIPQIYNARRFSVEMEKFPTILRIEEVLFLFFFLFLFIFFFLERENSFPTSISFFYYFIYLHFLCRNSKKLKFWRKLTLPTKSMPNKKTIFFFLPPRRRFLFPSFKPLFLLSSLSFINT